MTYVIVINQWWKIIGASCVKNISMFVWNEKVIKLLCYRIIRLDYVVNRINMWMCKHLE